jgi:phosphate transport system protein
LHAFARLEADEAFEVARRDRKIDEEYEAIQRQNITFMMEDPRSIRRALEIMWVVRALERIGDHAKNIGEHVVYAAMGQDVRHATVHELERLLQK